MQAKILAPVIFLVINVTVPEVMTGKEIWERLKSNLQIWVNVLPMPIVAGTKSMLKTIGRINSLFLIEPLEIITVYSS